MSPVHRWANCMGYIFELDIPLTFWCLINRLWRCCPFGAQWSINWPALPSSCADHPIYTRHGVFICRSHYIQGDLMCLNLCIALRCLIINTYKAILIFAHVWAIAGVIDWSAPEKLRNHSPTPNNLPMLEIEGRAALSTSEIFTSTWCVHQRLFHVKHCKYTSYLTFNWKTMLRCLPMSQVNTRVDHWGYVT